MTEKLITLGLDARLAGQKNAGLGRYINNLALRLPFFLPDNYRLVYFFHDKNQWSELVAQIGTLDLAQGKNVQDIFSKIKLVYTPIRHYSLAEQTQLPQVFAQEKLDLLHVPHFNAPYFLGQQKFVLTIHDLLWHEKKGLTVTTLPAWKYHLKYFAYRFLTNRVVKKATKIIVVSQTCQKTVLKFYPKVKSKLQLIYNGVNQFKLSPLTTKFAIPLPKNFLLYVGSLYPHKNLTIVLQALAQEKSLHLVIVSARDAFWEKTYQQIANLKIAAQVTFLGQVSDAQLNYLYRQAQALIQPSLSEGFGLTGIEALQVQTPVIASNIAVFQEIYGHAYTDFKPDEVADFLRAVKKSAPLKNDPTWQKLAAQQVSRYSWDKMAQQTVQIYQEILAKND